MKFIELFLGLLCARYICIVYFLQFGNQKDSENTIYVISLGMKPDLK